jgi:hypothetical protein
VAAAGVLSVRYPYKIFPLDDGSYDWAPVLPMQISKASRVSPMFQALLDTGATNCLFHASLGRMSGLDIESGEVAESGGIVPSATMKVYYHEIRVHVGSDSFEIRAAFSDDLPFPGGFLGRRGFFDRYIVTFDPSSTPPGFETRRVR